MSGGLSPYGSGGWDQPVPFRESRKMMSKIRELHDEGRIADFKEEVVFRMGGRNMQRAAMLDAYRHMVNPQEDPSLNTILAAIELITLDQAKHIQQRLFGDE
jgi:hypothetical protein